MNWPNSTTSMPANGRTLSIVIHLRAAVGSPRICYVPRGLSMSAIAAVVFDIGGVVQDSPLHVLARYERERGLPANAINRVVVATGERGAWARLERGELTLQTFYAPLQADCPAPGIAAD